MLRSSTNLALLRSAFSSALMPVLVILCAGCKAKPASNGLMPITLQTDWYPQPEMGGFYQAQLEGLYQREGLDVTIAPGGPANDVNQKVATGAAQFGMSTSDTTLVAVARGLPIVAVAATMQQDPQAIMVHAGSPVRSFPDLEGHTISVRQGSIWFEYLVKRFHYQNVRETPNTYSVANFIQDPNFIQQAFVTSEPYFARKAGAEVRTLLVSETGYQPYRVYITSRSFLAEHPEVVAKFVRASTKGWKDYLADPAATNTLIEKLNPAMSPDWAQFSASTLKGGHFVDGDNTETSHLGHMTDQRWAAIYKQLDELHELPHAIDPKTAYTLQFAP